MGIIPIRNQEGATGKITTALNLGGALAELGRQVLALDRHSRLSSSCWRRGALVLAPIAAKSPVSVRADSEPKVADNTEKVTRQRARERRSPTRLLHQSQLGPNHLRPRSGSTRGLKTRASQPKELVGRASFLLNTLDKRLQDT